MEYQAVPSWLVRLKSSSVARPSLRERGGERGIGNDKVKKRSVGIKQCYSQLAGGVLARCLDGRVYIYRVATKSNFLALLLSFILSLSKASLMMLLVVAKRRSEFCLNDHCNDLRCTSALSFWSRCCVGCRVSVLKNCAQFFSSDGWAAFRLHRMS